MRDSKRPVQGHLMFASYEWSTFISSLGTEESAKLA